MDLLRQFTDEDRSTLGTLLRARKVAALGTLHGGAPNVGMVLFAPAPDFAGFFLHLSQLALHTQDLRAAPAAGLLVAERDSDSRNPQTLARVSLQGEARLIAAEAPEYAAAKAVYLERFPFAQFNFTLPDFSLFRFVPAAGRYVGGFGKAFAVTPEDLRRAAALTAG
ncbi:MAG: pyridoxamine 5'-phosphate oxidase family protein [Anaerolineales bacterium]|nr:pyridoxamine 5'-phosphate oxidase family protein [Anaerolineales bacterium]